MKYHKILNSLNKSSNSKFVARKWNIVNDQTNANYDVRNEIFHNTEVLKSNLCHYIDAYILAKGDIITTALNNSTPVAFKNCAPFIKNITNIDGTTIDDDLDLVVPMYNLLQYSLF